MTYKESEEQFQKQTDYCFNQWQLAKLVEDDEEAALWRERYEESVVDLACCAHKEDSDG